MNNHGGNDRLNKNINKYLDWNIKQTKRLIDNKFSIKRNNNSISVIDLPVFKTKQQYSKFVAAARQAGYKFLNIGLTPVWKNTMDNNLLAWTSREIPIISAHGSSIKQQIKTGTPYSYFLNQDLILLKKIDPHGRWQINYDLFAGQHGKTRISSSHKKTKEDNIDLLLKELSISEKNDPHLLILEKIINDVAEVYKGTGRKICFEIPGTRGWSFFPEISELNLKFIVRKIKQRFPDASLCIDLGHVITWGRSKKHINNCLNILEKYKRHISMVHISSAGSWTKLFVEIFKQVNGSYYPDWHIKSLDLSLPIFERSMLGLLLSLRKLLVSELLEVSETRLPEVAINDYLKSIDHSEINNEAYFDELLKQGKILGYTNY